MFALALFADNDTATAMAIVSFMSSTIAAIFAYLASRDKNRFELTKLGLERDVKDLQERLTTSEVDRRNITDRLVIAEKEYRDCKEDRTKLHGLLHNQKTEIAVLRAQIGEATSGETKLPTDIADAAS